MFGWIKKESKRKEEIVDLLSHEDLEPIDLPVKSYTKGILALEVTAGLVFSFFGFFFFITAPSQLLRLEYYLKNDNSKEAVRVVDINTESKSISQAIFIGLNTKKFFKVGKTLDPEEKLNLAVKEGELYIPKIGTRAPVVWDSGFENDELKANLKKGVAHYSYTVKPNSQSGNVFITGHSSDYWWNEGRYKTIFTLLDKLSSGDQAFIRYKDRVFVYEVADSFIVSPKKVEVTAQTARPMLTLMTCSPIGTAINRLIVRLSLVKVYES